MALVLVACSEKEEPQVELALEEEKIERSLSLHPIAEGQSYDKAVYDIVVREDPEVDGWESEVFSEFAMKQLKKLGSALRSDQFPEDVFSESREETWKANESEKIVRRVVGAIVTRGGRVAEEHLAHFAKGGEDSRFKFKISDVKMAEDGAETLVLVQYVYGLDSKLRKQVNATWRCYWTKEELARIRRIEVLADEVVESESRFIDCTAEALSDQKLIDDQFRHGRNHWYRKLEGALGVEGRGNGIAIGDVNNDGLEDLYICQSAALPNRLLLRQQDGSLRDVSARSGVDWLDSTRAALFVDIDNDGDQDLVISQSTRVIVHENAGNGKFPVRATLSSKSLLFSLNAVDYDNDGDLDLFVCGYSGAQQISPQDVFASPMPYHDANNGAPNALLSNEGGWMFRDVTSEAGLAQNNLRFSLASVWEDYDNDGDQDLYVANDFGRNNLFRNDNGKFVEASAEAGVEDIGPGMSASWGDVNNDGLVDLYVSNMFSSAGSRITRQSQFNKGMSDVDLEGFQRHARGNSLFINQGDGTFLDEAESSATVMGRWAWGSLFVDLNNDGWKDLYVTNGFVTADQLEDDL